MMTNPATLASTMTKGGMTSSAMDAQKRTAIGKGKTMSNITREDAAKWLTNLIDDCGRYQDLWHYAEALEQIIKLLDADVAPVVRCGECKYLMVSGICNIFADGNIKPSASDFCSYGERKDND